MTLPFKEPPTFYEDNGFYWLVAGPILLQFTGKFCNPWPAGTELFGCKVRELRHKKDIQMDFSEGDELLGQLIEMLEGIRKSIQKEEVECTLRK